MKTLLPILFLCLTRISFSQTYFPFPTDSAQWCFEYFHQHPDDLVGFDHLFFYSLESDTLIHGVQYKNIGLTRTWLHIVGWDGMEVSTYDGTDVYFGYVGAMREEDKRVYFYKYIYGIESFPPVFMADTTEVLLYDFNLNSGDSVLMQPNFGPTYAYVNDVDSILLFDGFYHKRLIVNCAGTSQYWIEGVGDSQSGFLGPYIYDFYEGIHYTFYTLTVNGAQLYIHDSFGDCDFVVGIDDIQSTHFSVYPNPTCNLLHVKIPESGKNLSVELFDVFGRDVLTDNLYETENITSLNGLSNGVYLVNIYQGGVVVYSTKVIKQN